MAELIMDAVKLLQKWQNFTACKWRREFDLTKMKNFRREEKE